MKKLLLTGGCFTLVILLIHFVSIRVFHGSGLGFEIHVYSGGLTAVPATIAFAWCLRREGLGAGFVSLIAVVCGAAWWFLTFLALFCTNGAFGGRY